MREPQHDERRTDSDRLQRLREITDHAPLRLLQRIDPTEAFPRQRLRDMFERARHVRRDDVEGDAYLDPETDALLVVDERDRTLVTVLDGGTA